LAEGEKDPPTQPRGGVRAKYYWKKGRNWIGKGESGKEKIKESRH